MDIVGSAYRTSPHGGRLPPSSNECDPITRCQRRILRTGRTSSGTNPIRFACSLRSWVVCFTRTRTKEGFGARRITSIVRHIGDFPVNLVLIVSAQFQSAPCFEPRSLHLVLQLHTSHRSQKGPQPRTWPPSMFVLRRVDRRLSICGHVLAQRSCRAAPDAKGTKGSPPAVAPWANHSSSGGAVLLGHSRVGEGGVM